MINKLLYGVAYYDEYMPEDRLNEDITMMKEAGINTVRIAESTWSTLEPQDGVINFYHIDRVLDAMNCNGIMVIIGTPTYAIPTWMVKAYPSVLAQTEHGQNQYGPRQKMDITNPTYLFYAERIIRTLTKHVCHHPAVIGFQVDNETKHYQTSGSNVLYGFIKQLKNKFATIEELNKAYGLDYWSNRINSWEDFPSMNATINTSLWNEYETYRRSLVTDFIKWQDSIIRDYKLPEQFITHNFDFDWREHSFGLQPNVNHYVASRPLDIVGIDVYHPSQDDLTGKEIAFCGDIARSLKQKNYYVLETEAQGFPKWLPYPGQLRLQAFSHIGSGATMVGYWHWHSIHNSAETYWKGLLSHDFARNRTYEESKIIGKEFAEHSEDLIGLHKENHVAIIVSNASLTSLQDSQKYGHKVDYNNQLRSYYDALYKLNVECDFIFAEQVEDLSQEILSQYQIIVVPALYTSIDNLLESLNAYTKKGGTVIYGMRSGFCNEHVKVRQTTQPGIISSACGASYNQFTEVQKISLISTLLPLNKETDYVDGFIELLNPVNHENSIATYDHPYWNRYAAITQNKYGNGMTYYIGCQPSDTLLTILFAHIIKNTLPVLGLDEAEPLTYPIIIKRNINSHGHHIDFYYNYSAIAQTIKPRITDAKELLSAHQYIANSSITLEPWDVKIFKY